MKLRPSWTRGSAKVCDDVNMFLVCFCYWQRVFLLSSTRCCSSYERNPRICSRYLPTRYPTLLESNSLNIRHTVIRMSDVGDSRLDNFKRPHQNVIKMQPFVFFENASKTLGGESETLEKLTFRAIAPEDMFREASYVQNITKVLKSTHEQMWKARYAFHIKLEIRAIHCRCYS